MEIEFCPYCKTTNANLLHDYLNMNVKVACPCGAAGMAVYYGTSSGTPCPHPVSEYDLDQACERAIRLWNYISKAYYQ